MPYTCSVFVSSLTPLVEIQIYMSASEQERREEGLAVRNVEGGSRFGGRCGHSATCVDAIETAQCTTVSGRANQFTLMEMFGGKITGLPAHK